jgi:hypothetical protein
LDAASFGFRIIEGNLFEGGFRLRLERDFHGLQIAEVCSAKTPHLFDTLPVTNAGGFHALVGLPLTPERLIQETKARLLAP